MEKLIFRVFSHYIDTEVSSLPQSELWSMPVFLGYEHLSGKMGFLLCVQRKQQKIAPDNELQQ